MPMKITDLHTLLVHELKDLYSAETQLVEALPTLAQAANNSQLANAFRSHLEETREHVSRLETIFEGLDYEPSGQHCKGMEGLIAEGKDMVEEDAPDDVKDAGLITAAQRVEHYEMAGYGCARTFARQLGLDSIADLLQTTLDEEGAADKKLTGIAERSINQEAING
ncbi:MAG: ferritin-like domain-containing protein [Gemmatimonadaceae bacterium]